MMDDQNKTQFEDDDLKNDITNQNIDDQDVTGDVQKKGGRAYDEPENETNMRQEEDVNLNE